MQLYKLTDNYLAIADMLDSGETETLLDTLESITDAIEIKAESMIKIDKMLDYSIDNIDAEIKRLQQLKAQRQNNKEHLRQYLKIQLEKLKKDKIKTDLGTISIRQNPGKLVIDDEKEIPASFLTVIPEHYEINKAALKDAIKLGEFVPGAHIESGTSLQIK